MKKTIAILFFLFICWVIYLANWHRGHGIFYYPDRVPFGDKLAHFLLYGVLALFTNTALGFRYFKFGRSGGGLTKYCQIGSICVLAFALLEELSQQYFPSRTLDSGDAISDMLGVGLFTLISVAMMNRRLPATGT